MKEDGPRLNKLKLIYKKAIQEVLKEEQAVREILADPDTSAGDSFFASNSKTSDAAERDVDATNKAVAEIFADLRTRLSELFKGRLRTNSIDEKLNQLDRDIAENRISLKDISSEEYIREIFSSHIVYPKVGYIEHIEDAKRRSTSRIDALKTELEDIATRTATLKRENEASDRLYSRLVDTFLETVKSKHSS